MAQKEKLLKQNSPIPKDFSINVKLINKKTWNREGESLKINFPTEPGF